jgi:hypothetical protein
VGQEGQEGQEEQQGQQGHRSKAPLLSSMRPVADTMSSIPSLMRTLRQTIVEHNGGESEREEHCAPSAASDSCRAVSLAALLGLSKTQYYHFLEYVERGYIPPNAPNTALYNAAVGLAFRVRDVPHC